VCNSSSSAAVIGSKLSCSGSYQSCHSVSAGSHAVTNPECVFGQHAAAWRSSSSCQAWNVVLAVTAVSVVLLLLALNYQQVAPCQTAAGEQGIRQAEGCLLTHQSIVVSGAVHPSGSDAHLLFAVLLYAPFMALLLLTVSLASKVCIVL
jgi:hypothetical protein